MNEPLIASDKSGDELPSRVVPGLLSALSILPLGMMGALSPTMLAQVRDGSMSHPNLLETWLSCACLVAALALMFLRRRGPRTLFVASAILGVACVGAPFGRLVLGVVIVAVIGAVVTTVQARPRD